MSFRRMYTPLVRSDACVKKSESVAVRAQTSIGMPWAEALSENEALPKTKMASTYRLLRRKDAIHDRDALHLDLVRDGHDQDPCLNPHPRRI